MPRKKGIEPAPENISRKQAKLPWAKFSLIDFCEDLFFHPREIAGVWMFILRRLHHSSTRGKLTLPFRGWVAAIGSQSEFPAEKTREWLIYIRDSNIADISGDLAEANGLITIVSRRMIRDENTRLQKQASNRRSRGYSEDDEECGTDVESNEEVNEEVNEEANEEVNEEANEEAMWNGRCLEVRCLDSRGDKGRGGTAFSAVRGLGGTEELGSSSQDPYAGVLGEKAVSNLVPRCDADLFPKGSGKRKAPPCPYEAIADLFREKLVPPLPEPNLDKEIKKIIRARWLSSPEMSSLDWWSAYFDFVGNCDFLMGRTSDFHASFFWLVGPKNLSKVMNGQYLDNRHKGVFSQAAVNTAINLRRFVNQMQGGEKK